MLVLFLPIIAVWYLLIIRPAKREQQKKAAMIGALKKGDRVVTSGGIYGTIAAVEEQAVQLKVSENVKIRVAKNAVAGLTGGESSERG
jgi:preprotein translocase subunit YajC